jgi:hypothetical protein
VTQAYGDEAQSVSALPPAGSPADQTARSRVTSSSQSFSPKPGGNSTWDEQRYRPPADYESNKAAHPYSTAIGPKPDSDSKD